MHKYDSRDIHREKIGLAGLTRGCPYLMKPSTVAEGLLIFQDVLDQQHPCCVAYTGASRRLSAAQGFGYWTFQRAQAA